MGPYSPRHFPNVGQEDRPCRDICRKTAISAKHARTRQYDTTVPRRPHFLLDYGEQVLILRAGQRQKYRDIGPPRRAIPAIQMENQIKKITGNWDAGLVLDKHTRSSIFLGYDERGNTRFETKRSEVGEALFQLKYRGDFNKVEALAKEIATHIAPQFAKIGFIVPMPPSRHRPRQPVTEIAKSLSQTLQVPMFDNILVRVPPNPDQKPAKDLVGKEAKVEAMKDRFGLQQNIANEGKWNVLLVDDLYDTGASMEAATAKLREYKKVGNVYVAALTWK